MSVPAIHTLCRRAGSILLVMLFCLPFLSYSQSGSKNKYPAKGSLTYLDFINGFNGIALGDSISRLPGSSLKYMDGNSRVDDDGCLKYEYNDPTWKRALDSLNIRAIGFRSWGDRIINIYIFFKRINGATLLDTFLQDYGTFTSKPDDYKDNYYWEAEDVSLSLQFDLQVDMGVAVFTSKPLYKRIGLAKVKTLLPAKDAGPPATQKH